MTALFWQRVAWWLALPVRLVLTGFIVVVLFSVFPKDSGQIRPMLKDLWARP
jgi:hypothetical protein